MIFKQYKHKDNKIEAVEVIVRQLTSQDVKELNNWLAPAEMSCRMAIKNSMPVLYIDSDAGDMTYTVRGEGYIVCDFTVNEIQVFSKVSLVKCYEEVA